MNPKDDGKTHINIYSKGQTSLGRILSNFAHTPVDLGEDGRFASLEGYWYWLLSNKDDKAEVLRTAYGWEAKRLGRELRCPDWPTTEEFVEKFSEAMWAKVNQNPHIFEMLQRSELPFKHYYVYGNGAKVVDVPEGQWIIDTWEDIRSMLKNSAK